MLHGSRLIEPAPVAGAAQVQGKASLSERLRAETGEAHRAVERGLDDLLRHPTVARYLHVLARLYGFHAAWEPEAAAALGDHALFEPRRKLHLIAADLGHLGREGPPPASAPAGHDADRPAMRGPADVLGAMYVLEGSTLGGQIIARRLESALGPDVAGALSYYRAYGRQVAPMWRDFKARLDREPAASHESVVAAARATFAHLRARLSPG